MWKVVTFPEKEAGKVLKGEKGSNAIENFYAWLVQKTLHCSYEEILGVDPTKISIGQPIHNLMLRVLTTQVETEEEAKNLMYRFGPYCRAKLNNYEVEVMEDAFLHNKKKKVKAAL